MPSTNFGILFDASWAKRNSVSAMASFVNRSKSVSTYPSRSMPGTGRSVGRASRSK